MNSGNLFKLGLVLIFLLCLITACSSSGGGPVSIPAKPDAPSDPTNVNILAASSTQINLSWTDTDGETGYRIYRNTVDTQPSTPLTYLPANSNLYSDLDVETAIEYFYWIVAYNSGGDSAIITLSATTLTVSLAFQSANSATANENASTHTVTMQLTMPNGETLTSPLTATVSTNDGTTTANADYNTVSEQVTFPTGSVNGATQTVNVSILHDKLIEGNETFSLNLFSISSNGIVSGQTSHTITITDDETLATVAFQTSTSTTADESSSNHPVTLVLTKFANETLASPLTVKLNSTGGTATTGSDYTTIDLTVTFPAASENNDTQIVSIPIKQDLIVEGNESIELTLSNVSTNGTLGGQTAHTVTITDDESATVVAFQAATSNTTNEATGNHNINVLLTTALGVTLAEDLTIDVDITANTAILNSDYTAIAGSLTFPAGSGNGTSLPVELGILQDTLIEGNETVTLTLSNISANATIGTQSSHVATITDDEAVPTVAFIDASSASVDETGNHDITIRLSTGVDATLAVNLTFDLNSSDGSALAGNDYAGIVSTLTYAIGSGDETDKVIAIPIQADTLIEGDETFILTLSDASAIGSLGTQTTHTATITDDEDTPTVEFLLSDSATANEITGDHSITVILNATAPATLAEDVSFNYASSDVTAGVNDYDAVSGSLTFVAGSGDGATKTIDVAIYQDNLIEDDENFLITLSNISGQATLGAQSTHDTTITDDESIAVISFQIASSSTADESTQNHSITVILNTTGTGVLVDNLTIDVTDTGGSAAADVDFSAVSETITFTAGSGNGVNKTVNLPVLQDTLIEGNETVVLSLSNVSANGIIGVQKDHTATITDDDPVPPATIDTTAGDGTQGFGGDGAAATNAEINTPKSVAIDQDNNLYIVDTANNRIRKMSIATGIISTIAGDGSANFAGDGGLANIAQINLPESIATDAAGNIYIADTANHRIRKINNATGLITTIAGDGTQGFSGDGAVASLAQLDSPAGITIDAGNIVYIADTANNRIRKIDPQTGIISTIAGDGTATYGGDTGLATAAQVNSPANMVTDNNGDLYIADAGNNRIRKITLQTGVITTIAGNGTGGFAGDAGQAISAQINSASGLGFDPAGDLFIADTANNRIRKVDMGTGIISTIVGDGVAAFSGDTAAASLAQIDKPTNIAFDQAGNLYIADENNHRIRKTINLNSLIISNANLSLATIDSYYINSVRATGASGLALSWSVSSGTLPTGLSLSSSSPNATISGTATVAGDYNFTLYVVDSLGFYTSQALSITVIDPQIDTIAGDGNASFSGDSGLATSATLDNPIDVSLDNAGNIYIADFNNHRIRKIDGQTGIISTIAGDGTASFSGDGGLATSARLNFPRSIAVDDAGNVYIADSANSRVRKISADTGFISTLAGDGSFGFAGDSALAVDSVLNNPVAVALDESGNLYISDYNNHRVRKIDVHTGIITTVAGDGTQSYGGDTGLAVTAKLNNPRGLTFDSSGNLYIADFSNHRIRKVTATTGIITTIAGDGTASFSGDGATATSAKLDSPSALAFDQYGNMYIVDQGNMRVRKIDAQSNLIATVVGDGTQGFTGDSAVAIDSQMDTPEGIGIDNNGNLYIADQFNHRIRKIGE